MKKKPSEESRKKKEDRDREKREELEDDATMSFQVKEKRKVRDDELEKRPKRERQDNSKRLQSQSKEILTGRGNQTDVEILDVKRVSLKIRSETGEK